MFIYHLFYIYIMDMKKILENARNIGSTFVEDESDISKEILKVARSVYEDSQQEKSEIKGQNPWWRGVDMLTKLNHLGKANVRNHLEKLADRKVLESGLHGTKKVYRIRIVEDEAEQ